MIWSLDSGHCFASAGHSTSNTYKRVVAAGPVGLATKERPVDRAVVTQTSELSVEVWDVIWDYSRATAKPLHCRKSTSYSLIPTGNLSDYICFTNHDARPDADFAVGLGYKPSHSFPTFLFSSKISLASPSAIPILDDSSHSHTFKRFSFGLYGRVRISFARSGSSAPPRPVWR